MLNEEENVNLKIKEGVLVIKDIFNTGPGVIWTQVSIFSLSVSQVFIILLHAEVTLQLNTGDINVAQQLGEMDGGPQEGVDQ